MWALDRDFNNRIETNDPFLSFQATDFLRQADRNWDGGGDRVELESAISWRIDRNHDNRITDVERRQAGIDFGFPARY